jgi:hypothetical protein
VSGVYFFIKFGVRYLQSHMKHLLMTLFCCSFYFSSSGQGCSDAGFCTMGAMKPDQPYNKKTPIKLRTVELNIYRGQTTLSPVVYVATLDASFSVFGNKNAIQIKLPYQTVTGNFSTTSGLSDISLCFTRNIYSRDKFDINVSVGGKLPSNNSDLKDDKTGLPLPMYYQTSLGTYDFITGISLITRKWLFATGLQYPFNENKNEFLWGPWEPIYKNGEGVDYVRQYAKAFHLKRGTDVMFRVERNFRYSQLNFSIGLLNIYRVTPDEIENPITGERTSVDGTTGLALSGIGTVGYNFNIHSGVKLVIGHKIIQRELAPDGLTRDLVTSVSYYYRF